MNAITYLNHHQFTESLCERYERCDVIRFHNELWIFIHRKYDNYNTEIQVFVNKNGELLEIDLNRTRGITHMEEI
jgi:hypothetical protein